MNQRVFISYSSVDDGVARSVADTLAGLGIDYFLDSKDIKWGDDISGEIKKSLADCSHLIVVLSPASLKSQWVPFEIGHASALDKRILPFVTHPSLSLPGYLQAFHHKTRIEDIRAFFESSPSEGAVHRQPGTHTSPPPGGPGPGKKFNQADAAGMIMSGLIKGYAQRILAAETREAVEKERADLAQKIQGLGEKHHMPPEVFRIYLDEMLEAEEYLDVGEFALRMRDEKKIKSWSQPVGQAVVDWLMNMVFSDKGTEEAEQHDPGAT